MFRNVTMLIPLLAGLLALIIADDRGDYLVAGAFILGSALVWGIWKVVDGAVTRDQQSNLDQ